MRTLLLVGAAAAAWWFPELALDRGTVGAEPWQLLTGHLTHWTGTHLLWDGLMVLALGGLMERAAPRQWLGVTLGSALAVSAAVLLATDLGEYRGLSGLAWVYAGWGALHFRHRLPILPWLLVARLGAELVWPGLFVGDLGAGVVTVGVAHLVGAACGLLAGLKGMPRSPSLSASPSPASLR